MRHAGDSGRVQAAPTRRERIVRLLLERGSMRTEDIGREIGASAATVRRDLILLARQGRLVRYHGGASTSPARPTPSDVVRELEAGVALLHAADLPLAEAFLRTELDRHRRPRP